MKYRPDINKIPESDRINSDRNRIRIRNRIIKKFSKIIYDKFWWSSITDNNKWFVYTDFCYYKTTVHQSPSKESIKKFIDDCKVRYKGDINLIRELKINEIMNNKIN